MFLIDIKTNEGWLTVNRDQIAAIRQSDRDVQFWVGEHELTVENTSVKAFVALLGDTDKLVEI